MVPILLAALLTTATQGDTATFADARTEALYYRARERHLRQDSIVRDYQATVHTRIEATAGRSRFAKLTTLWVHESEAEVAWQAPNDLKIRVVGVRTKVPLLRLFPDLREAEDDVRDEFRGRVLMDRPWFIPRSLGDSIRLMGLPTVAALHPLAIGGEEHYRFAVRDSAQLRLPGRTVRTARVKVEPRRMAPALVAGQMWLDVETGDVVRMRLLFLGTYLWDLPEDPTAEDSVEARKVNDRVMRHVTLEAELEYALVNSQYWMPLRQYLGVTAEVPLLVNLTIPARAVSTFGNYVVNSGVRFAFAIPDTILDADGEDESSWNREGEVDPSEERRDLLGYSRGAAWRDGRWEVTVPPRDSVASFAWEEELATSFDAVEEARLRETVAELAALEDRLPSEWTARRRLGLAWQQVSDVVRFNRVQGISLGAGMQFRPRTPHTSVLVSGRMGLSDLRPLANVTLRHDGPAGRLDFMGYRDLREVEPWTRGLGVGNSLNALFTGHDDADYFLTAGGGLEWTWNAGALRNLEIRLGYEWHDGVVVTSGSGVADLWGTGIFQPNPPVTEGWFGVGELRWDRRFGPMTIGAGVGAASDWSLVAGRGWVHTEVGFRLLQRTGKIGGKIAATRGDSLPQARWRLGGPQTVRGFAYGTRQGAAMWAVQLDMALTRSGAFTPVVFVDVGDTFDRDPLVGVGGGISILHGLLRFNVAAGVRPATKVRFDLLFRAPR
ncbi:MAG TPA: hypothetical protein VGA22_11175 [Gemmatimonadales bacterium]|jgi:hypothetical protein